MEEVAARRSVEGTSGVAERRRPSLLRYLRPQTGAALVLWRVEAYSVTPLALLLITLVGRWPGALIIGLIMAAYSAVFLHLLQDDPIVEDVRAWTGRRRLGRALDRLAARGDAVGKVGRAASVVVVVMVLGPFWRAVAFHMVRMPRPAAYVLSVGGSIPHSLLWIGLVLGGIWEGLIWPWIRQL